MFDLLISITSVVVVLGILVLVHEWGHFVVAKLFGVRVEIFSIGFGTRLGGWRRGPTDYRISALPLGGYVKMAGDNPAEERQGAPDEFLSKPRWQRAIIALAGPAMNLVTAIIIVAILYVVGMPEPAYLQRPAEVGGVMRDSPAEKAGLQPGDVISQVNGVSVSTWEKALTQTELALSRPEIPVVVERDNETETLMVQSPGPRSTVSEVSLLGAPHEPVIVGRVTPDMPADRAGLKTGDQVLAINDHPVLSQIQASRLIQDADGHPLQLLVQRGDRQLRLQVKPTYGDPRDGFGPRWQIGYLPRSENTLHSYPFPQAIGRSVAFNVKQTGTLLQLVARLFEAKASIKQLAGPVQIAQLTGQAARLGLAPELQLMGILSLSLAILNLLPIPILDGGHILMLAIEGSLRRDLSVAIKERFVQVGLVFLLVIIVIVTYNDVLRIIPGR